MLDVKNWSDTYNRSRVSQNAIVSSVLFHVLLRLNGQKHNYTKMDIVWSIHVNTSGYVSRESKQLV